MKILRLETTGFKRIVAVDITPTGGLNEVRGDNAEGKTSLLDSIKAAIGGADAAPIKPIRTGADHAAIRVTLGDGKPDLIVEKYFDEVGEKLRVTNADGAEYKAGQTTLNDLLGRMTFDPLAFARMKPDVQAAELRRVVKLSVDLDELAAADKADLAKRRDINRDAKTLVIQRDAINISGVIPPRPDREAIVAKLRGAAETNAAIGRERDRRAQMARVAETQRASAVSEREKARRLREEADRIEDGATAFEAAAVEGESALVKLPALAEAVDTAKLAEDLDAADRDLALLSRKANRDALDAEATAKAAESEALTKAVADRAKLRTDALAAAVMPVPGLSLARICDVVATEDSEDLIVVYEGEPFSQASGAQQLRVSMRLAMDANPRLRVMLIKDGSLLDAKGLEIVRELAADRDYQVWLESVGEGDGTGIVMEAGVVRGAGEIEPLPAPTRRKPKAAVNADAESLGAASDPEHGATVDTSHDEGRRQPESGPPPVEAPAAPARRRPSAMRSFSSPSAPGLFGSDE